MMSHSRCYWHRLPDLSYGQVVICNDHCQATGLQWNRTTLCKTHKNVRYSHANARVFVLWCFWSSIFWSYIFSQLTQFNFYMFIFRILWVLTERSFTNHNSVYLDVFIALHYTTVVWGGLSIENFSTTAWRSGENWTRNRLQNTVLRDGVDVMSVSTVFQSLEAVSDSLRRSQDTRRSSDVTNGSASEMECQSARWWRRADGCRAMESTVRSSLAQYPAANGNWQACL